MFGEWGSDKFIRLNGYLLDMRLLLNNVIVIKFNNSDNMGFWINGIYKIFVIVIKCNMLKNI